MNEAKKEPQRISFRADPEKLRWANEAAAARNMSPNAFCKEYILQGGKKVNRPAESREPSLSEAVDTLFSKLDEMHQLGFTQLKSLKENRAHFDLLIKEAKEGKQKQVKPQVSFGFILILTSVMILAVLGIEYFIPVKHRALRIKKMDQQLGQVRAKKEEEQKLLTQLQGKVGELRALEETKIKIADAQAKLMEKRRELEGIKAAKNRALIELKEIETSCYPQGVLERWLQKNKNIWWLGTKLLSLVVFLYFKRGRFGFGFIVALLLVFFLPDYVAWLFDK